MALNANALTTLTFCKDYLDIENLNTSEDARIEFFINQASDAIERYCNRKFVSQTFTEIYDGRNYDRLLVNQYPISSITSIYVDPSWVFDSTSLIAATEYQIANESEIRYKSIFPRGIGNIKITYVAGYAAIPSALEGACLQLVDYLYQQRSDRRAGISQKSKNQENVSFIIDMPPVIKTLLEPFVRCDFAQNIAGINQ